MTESSRNNQIPPEILNSIIYTSVFCHHDFYSRTQAAIRCSSVCKSWRTSALQDGRLWSSIDCRQHRLTATLLERSRRFSISVHIRLVTSNQSDLEHNTLLLHSFRQILDNSYRLKDLRAAFSSRAWRIYQLDEILGEIRPDFGPLERFECAHYNASIEISSTWFTYGIPIPLTRLDMLDSFMDWHTLVQLPLEDLIIKSDITLDKYRNEWYGILSGLAPSLRMLYVDASTFRVRFSTDSMVELPCLRVLDIPFVVLIEDTRPCFLDLVRLPIDCDIVLRASDVPAEDCNLQDDVNAHFGHFASQYKYRLYCGPDEFILAPTSGLGQLRVTTKLGELDLSLFGAEIQPAIRTAVTELEVHCVHALFSIDYGWPARIFPNVTTITYAPTKTPHTPEIPLQEFDDTVLELGIDIPLQPSSYTLVDFLAAAAYKAFPELHTLKLRDTHLDDPSVDEHHILAAMSQRVKQGHPLSTIWLDRSCMITSNFRAAMGGASPHTTVMLDGQQVPNVGEPDT